MNALSWSQSALTALGGVLLSAIFAPAQPPAEQGQAAKAADDARRVQQLIEQLDSDEFAVREAAAGKLEQLGIAAIAPLAEVAAGKSLEASTRAIAILGKLASGDDERVGLRATEALKELAQGDNTRVAAAAKATLAGPKVKPPPGIWQGESPVDVFGGRRNIIATDKPGVRLSGAGIAIGPGSQLALARTVDGVRVVDVLQGGNRGLWIRDGKEGIEIFVREPDEKGQPKIQHYRAKDAEQLAKEHPEIHKLYRQFDKYRNGTVIGGAGGATIGGEP